MVAPPLDPATIGLMRGVELQPSKICPKNFIIFDQTDKKSRVMFHPELAHKFNPPCFDICTSYPQDDFGDKDRESSSFKEDTKDIDFLMSLEEEEEDEDDEEEVSTGRTPGNCQSSSTDSFCSENDGSKSSKLSLSTFTENSVSGSGSGSGSGKRSNSRIKRERMKKMVEALRGIIPGGDRMGTAAILEEAVRYLQSLKVEVKKLGVGKKIKK